MTRREELKARGNAAFAAGDAAAAAALYTEALEAEADGNAAELRGDLLCNRAAARTQLKEFAAALADAEAAAACYTLPAREAKAWARAAAAHTCLGDACAAAESLRKAYALDGSQLRCEAYAAALFAIPARPVATAAALARPQRPGAIVRPGDIASPAPDALPLLLAAAAARGAKWMLPRLAAVTQLAALAACPELRRVLVAANRHANQYYASAVADPPMPRFRPRFVAPGAGLDALAAWASDDSLTRLPLPEAVQAGWAAALRVPYERSSLLLPAAAGFAAAMRHVSAERGEARGQAAAALLEATPATALRALCTLAARTPGCSASQQAVAEALRACLRAAEPAEAASERRVLAMLNAGAEEALEMLARNFRDADDKPRWTATWLLLEQLRHHPHHPKMKVQTD